MAANTLIPALEQIIKRGGALGVKGIVLGMAHRGRLNVLAAGDGQAASRDLPRVRGRLGYDPKMSQGSGDVKYHLGASRTARSTATTCTCRSPPTRRTSRSSIRSCSARRAPSRPSARRPWTTTKPRAGRPCARGAAADPRRRGVRRPGRYRRVLRRSRASRGYSTGGTMHFVINNQIGFTTSPTLLALVAVSHPTSRRWCRRRCST